MSAASRASLVDAWAGLRAERLRLLPLLVMLTIMRRPILPVACALLFASAATAGPIHDRTYPAPIAPLSLDGLPTGAALIAVTTGDGLRLAGVEVAGAADKPVLLVFHGNASAASGTVAWFAPLAAAGYGIVAAEYRGYSANPGRADERGLAADADAWLAHARALAGARRVIVVGHSLGSGVAFGLARRQRLDALVTIGAFTGLRAMAPKIARAFMSDRYDNLGAVPTLDEPWLLLHGTADDVVPASEGNRLHNAAVAAHRQGASFVLDGAGHRPDGALLAALIALIDARLAGAPWPAAMPAGVRLFPFG